MSYLRSRGALGAVSVSTISSALTAAGKVIEDPALPEVTRLVLKLHSLQRPSGAKAGGSTSTPAKGIGLQKIVAPLRAYVYTQENAWVIPAAILGVLAIPFLLGRTSKR